MTKLRQPVLAALAAVCSVGLLAADRATAPRAAKLDLTPQNFSAIGDVVRPQKNEWRHLRVHWHTDIVAARKKAAREDKPILVFRTGGAGYNDPLGQC